VAQYGPAHSGHLPGMGCPPAEALSALFRSPTACLLISRWCTEPRISCSAVLSLPITLIMKRDDDLQKGRRLLKSESSPRSQDESLGPIVMTREDTFGRLADEHVSKEKREPLKLPVVRIGGEVLPLVVTPRNPFRCHAITVSGFTISKAEHQPGHSRESQTQKARSQTCRRRRCSRLDRCSTRS
jgi:hypothetical protein